MVKSADGCQELRAGELATIVATVHAYGAVDTANFFYATDASNPVWVYIGSKNPTVSRALEDIEMTYTIPGWGSDIQAVRVQFRYDGPTTDPCDGADYSERDDVVFKVLPSLSPVTAPPSAAPMAPTASPTITLVFLPITSAQNTAFCIGLMYGETADDTQLWTYTCDASEPDQLWAYDSVGQLRSATDQSKCMTSGGQGATMVLSDCVGSSGQTFTFDLGRIKSGGLSIGVAGGCNGVTATRVQLQSVLNGGGCESQQKWTYN